MTLDDDEAAMSHIVEVASEYMQVEPLLFDLIRHLEGPIALSSLAWMITDQNALVPAEVIEGIRYYTDGAAMTSLPTNLDSFVLPR